MFTHANFETSQLLSEGPKENFLVYSLLIMKKSMFLLETLLEYVNQISVAISVTLHPK